jgi:small conductance mechanosensitive channel
MHLRWARRCAALAYWIGGRGLIGLIRRLLQQVLERQQVDPTLLRYIGNGLAVTPTIS